jgi:large subunit ribosomal protein L21
MSYAIISLGGKQYRVREGERLLVDRVATEEGKTFHPEVLMLGGDGAFELAPTGAQVTVKVVGSQLGKKIRIGKYKPKSGYKRHTGFRSSLTRIEITGIGARQKPSQSEAPAKKEPAAEPAAEAPKGLPKDYADMTVAQVSEGAKTWNRPMLEAAVTYEREHAKRKGALSALESALTAKDEKDGA